MTKRIFMILMCCAVALSFAAVSMAKEKETARQEKIKKAQEDLKVLDYYKGEATGKMDKATRDAVKEFQKKELDKKMHSGNLDENTCDEIAKKAENKLKKDKEKGTDKVDEGMKKIEEKKGKVEEGAGKVKNIGK